MSANAAHRPLSVAVASCAFDGDIADPEELLERYHAMTGWAEAIARAGAGAVTVVQRFRTEAVLRRGMVEYRFVADGGPGRVSPWFVGTRLARAVSALRPDAVHVDGFVFPALVGCLRWRL